LCAEIAQHGLKKAKCDSDYDELVFLFYGKTRYIVDHDLGNVKTDVEKMPAALLFDFDSVIGESKFERFLPFDSGGFERYGLSPPRKHYEVAYKNKREKLIELVRLIYNNHRHYLFDIVCSSNLDAAAEKNKTVEKLKDFYTKQQNKGKIYGLQSLAIEIQTSQALEKINPKILLVPYLEFASNRQKFQEIITKVQEHYKDQVTIISYLGSDIPEELFKNFKDIDDSPVSSKRAAPLEYLGPIPDGMHCEEALRREVLSQVINLCQK
jgi:hypothetical protein